MTVITITNYKLRGYVVETCHWRVSRFVPCDVIKSGEKIIVTKVVAECEIISKLPHFSVGMRHSKKVCVKLNGFIDLKF